MLSREEADRYDRQIRVWGAEVQGRIRDSVVFVAGLNGLHPEVIKNIVLAGVSIVIQDTRVVTDDDLSSNFFLNVNDIGKPMATAALHRIQDLNSYATVTVETRSLNGLNDNYFDKFNVILLSDYVQEVDAVRINNFVRNRANPAVTFWSGVFGIEGWFVSDFGDNFKYKPDSTANATTEIQEIKFSSFENILKRPWNSIVSKHYPLSTTYVKSRILSKFRDSNHHRNPAVSDIDAMMRIKDDLFKANNCDGNLVNSEQIHNLCSHSTYAPIMICSILGSFLSNEVIKAVSLSGKPELNIFVFSSDDYVVKVFPVI